MFIKTFDNTFVAYGRRYEINKLLENGDKTTVFDRKDVF